MTRDSNFSVSTSHHQRRFPVNIVAQENAKVGQNNFDWEGLSVIKLLKFSKKNLKIYSETGKKIKLTKFTQVCVCSNNLMVQFYVPICCRHRNLFASNPPRRRRVLLALSMTSSQREVRRLVTCVLRTSHGLGWLWLLKTRSLL